MNRVYTPSAQHPLRSPPMLPSGPTHCYPHHCAHCTCVRYHKVRLSRVRSKAVCTTQQVFCPERSTVKTSMNTPGAQTCHTTASHLIEHTHTHTHTHTHRAILHQHRNRRKCSPSHTEWFCLWSGTRHSFDCARNCDIHIAFGQCLERSMEQTHTTAELEHQIKNITHNTKQPSNVHALCRLTHCSPCIAEGTVE